MELALAAMSVGQDAQLSFLVVALDDYRAITSRVCIVSVVDDQYCVDLQASSRIWTRLVVSDHAQTVQETSPSRSLSHCFGDILARLCCVHIHPQCTQSPEDRTGRSCTRKEHPPTRRPDRVRCGWGRACLPAYLDLRGLLIPSTRESSTILGPLPPDL